VIHESLKLRLWLWLTARELLVLQLMLQQDSLRQGVVPVAVAARVPAHETRHHEALSLTEPRRVLVLLRWLRVLLLWGHPHLDADPPPPR
jgi:hypothetical protein